MTGTAERLRAGAGAAWAGLHDHPIVREMAAGTLPPAKFRFYVEQNLIYLPEFARALALGAAKARDEAEMRLFAAALTEVLEVEIPKNRELRDQVAALAPDAVFPPVMAPANRAYTSYLLQVAHQGGPVEVMAAIMPCAWSYGEIAAVIGDEVADHPVYTGWVRFFQSPGYHALVDELKGQLHRMAGERGADGLQEVFTTSVRMERGFWDMAYATAQWPDLEEAA